MEDFFVEESVGDRGMVKVWAVPRELVGKVVFAMNDSVGNAASGVADHVEVESAESIGILRSLGTETLWQPGVITRVFGTPALPARLFPEVGAAAALGEKSAGDASSSNPAAGTAAGTPAMAPPTPAATPAMAPPTPAATEPKSPASLASVIHRPGMLVAKTLLASDGSTVPLPPGVPPRHVLPQPPLPPSKSPSARPPQDPLVPSKGQTQQEREFTLPSPVGVASLDRCKEVLAELLGGGKESAFAGALEKVVLWNQSG